MVMISFVKDQTFRTVFSVAGSSTTGSSTTGSSTTGSSTTGSSTTGSSTAGGSAGVAQAPSSMLITITIDSKANRRFIIFPFLLMIF